MNAEERSQFIDMVAQAVIDKIEERNRVTLMTDAIVQRVIALQAQEAALKPHQDDIKKLENTNGTL